MRSRTTAIFLLVLALESAGQIERDRRGSYETDLAVPHPLGRIEEQMKRIGWKRRLLEEEDPGLVYDGRNERAFVQAPRSNGEKKPLGLLVWISPGDQGNCGADWPEVLDRRQVVFIGPHKAGNDRFVWNRIALALDAVKFAQDHYDIDPDRIWISGHSGGGRLASTLGLHWPDVFRGGIYCCGTNSFQKLRSADGKESWPARIPRPTGDRLQLARTRSRHLFVNGETDGNLAQSRAMAESLRRTEGFKQVTRLELPGEGHLHRVDGAWLEKVLAVVDAAASAAETSSER